MADSQTTVSVPLKPPYVRELRSSLSARNSRDFFSQAHIRGFHMAYTCRSFHRYGLTYFKKGLANLNIWTSQSNLSTKGSALHTYPSDVGHSQQNHQFVALALYHSAFMSSLSLGSSNPRNIYIQPVFMGRYI